MRAFPAEQQSFIQSRPRRQRQVRANQSIGQSIKQKAAAFFGGDSFDAPQPMRSVFSSGGKAARTLDERFGGRGQQFF